MLGRHNCLPTVWIPYVRIMQYETCLGLALFRQLRGRPCLNEHSAWEELGTDLLSFLSHLESEAGSFSVQSG